MPLTPARLSLFAATAAWLAAGAAGAAAAEGWDPVRAAYFSFTTLGIGGLQPPALGPDGALPAGKAAALAGFVLVGTPLFAAATGEAAAALLAVTVRRRAAAAGRRLGEEDEALAALLTAAVGAAPIPPPLPPRNDSDSAQTAGGVVISGGSGGDGGGGVDGGDCGVGSGRVGLGGLILLDLLREGRTDLVAVAALARRFDGMDGDGDGALDRREVPAAAPRRACSRE
jgi:hypothetical protein